MGTQLPKAAQPLLQFSAYVRCGQMPGWIKMPLGMEVALGPGDFVLDGDQAPLKKGHSLPIFGPCLLSIKMPLGTEVCLVLIWAKQVVMFHQVVPLCIMQFMKRKLTDMFLTIQR